MEKHSREQDLDVAGHEASLDEPSIEAHIRKIPGTVLDWLPGESMYSLMARNHRFWGYPRPRETVEVFFGTSSERTLNNHLSEIELFVAKTEGTLGGPNKILENHTLLQFYRAFMDAKQRQALTSKRLRAESLLKFPIAVWTSRFQVQHPLKACRVCIKDDLRDIGMAYWRVAHQYPGVWVCLKHGRPLQETKIKPSAQQRFLWHTPVRKHLSPAPGIVSGQAYSSKFLELAHLVTSIAADEIKGAELVNAGRSRVVRYVEQLGLLTSSGRLKVFAKEEVKILCNRFVEVGQELRELPEFRHLPKCAESAYRVLTSYINGRKALSPTTQIALIHWSNGLPL
nr:TniQ family protein [Pseudoduganella rivuli]